MESRFVDVVGLLVMRPILAPQNVVTRSYWQLAEKRGREERTEWGPFSSHSASYEEVGCEETPSYSARRIAAGHHGGFSLRPIDRGSRQKVLLNTLHCFSMSELTSLDMQKSCTIGTFLRSSPECCYKWVDGNTFKVRLAFPEGHDVGGRRFTHHDCVPVLLTTQTSTFS